LLVIYEVLIIVKYFGNERRTGGGKSVFGEEEAGV